MDNKLPHGADSAPEPAIDAEITMRCEAAEDAEDVAIFDERMAALRNRGDATISPHGVRALSGN